MMSTLLVSYFLHTYTPAAPVPDSPRVTQSVGELLTVTEMQRNALVTTPAGSQRVPMLTLELRASCDGPIRVTRLPLIRRGLGANDDIASVYALQDGIRVSPASPISNRDGSFSLSFRNVVIPACDRQELVIAADISADAAIAGQHRMMLDRTDRADAGTAEVMYGSGDPVTSSVTASDVSPHSNPSSSALAVRLIDVPGRIKFGPSRHIATVSLEAEGGTDHYVRSITFTNDGSASGGDIRNLYVTDSRGAVLSPVVPYMTDRRVRVPFRPPYFIEGGNAQRVELRADVVSGVGRTIRMVIEEPSDIHSVVSRRSIR